MIDFALPLAFLLLPLPLLFLFLNRDKTDGGALHLPSIDALPTELSTGAGIAWRQVVALLSWICFVVALAQPQVLGENESLPVTGRDLMMAMDISGSMDNRDFFWQGQRLTRLDAVRAVASDFVLRREGDRVGLILFGTKPYLQTPLTFDKKTVDYFLQDAVVGLAGKSTAIGDAIGLAVKRLRDRPSKSRVLVLLTDGDNTAGELQPKQAAELARQMDVRIHTIGVGSKERSFFGAVLPGSGIDEASLREVAELTGGQFFKAADTSELIDVYRALDTLEPAAAGDEIFRPKHAFFHWALAAALGFALLLLEPWGWRRHD